VTAPTSTLSRAFVPTSRAPLRAHQGPAGPNGSRAPRRAATRPATGHSAWGIRPAEAQPVAAVRVPPGDLADLRDALAAAGFGVLDILAQDVGPAPTVLVLDLPDDADTAARLLAASATGPGRVLVTADPSRLAGVRLRAGLDEVVEAPCHPLQVTAAALRVSGTAEYQLARWSESVFRDLPAR
jgi:hypothetical protein